MKPNDSINQCWFIRWLLFYELSFVLVLRRNWAFIRCKSPSRLSWNNKLNPWTTFREKNGQKYVPFSEPLHFSRTYLFLVSNWKIFWQMFILPINIVFFLRPLQMNGNHMVWFDRNPSRCLLFQRLSDSLNRSNFKWRYHVRRCKIFRLKHLFNGINININTTAIIPLPFIIEIAIVCDIHRSNRIASIASVYIWCGNFA